MHLLPHAGHAEEQVGSDVAHVRADLAPLGTAVDHQPAPHVVVVARHALGDVRHRQVRDLTPALRGLTDRAEQALEHHRGCVRGAGDSRRAGQGRGRRPSAGAGDDGAQAQAGAGQWKDARQSYEEAVKVGAQSTAAHTALAWLLATCWDDSVRDGKKAVEHATRACELTGWKDPASIDTLAAAYAEAGSFSNAVRTAQQAIETARAAGQTNLAQTIRSHLQLYQSQRPWRE